MALCYHCAQVFPADLKVVRSSECPFCRADARVCRNCVHYSPGSHWDCRESVSDQVIDKERANFCDWFRLNTMQVAGEHNTTLDKTKAARSGFAALFGDDKDPIKP